MPWFKVDDHFHSHRKTLATSPAALGLWVIAGSWAAANPDDGFVPDHVLPRLLPDYEPLVKELVERRWWQRAKGGYRFRNWPEYQYTKEEVEQKRIKDRERQRKRRAKLNAQVTDYAVTQVSQRESRSDNTVSHATPTIPNPTQPVVVTTSVGSSPEQGDEHRLEDEPRSAPVKLDARRISAEYCRTLKVVNVGKVCGIVTSAQQAYADDQIAAALSRLSKRPDLPLTHDVLRTEIETGGRQRLPNGCTLGDDGITRDADGRPIAGPGWEAY